MLPRPQQAYVLATVTSYGFKKATHGKLLLKI